MYFKTHLLSKLSISDFKEITLVDRLSMGNAMASVSEMKDKCLRTCKGEWKFMKANWEWVNERTNLEDPYKGGLHVSSISYWYHNIKFVSRLSVG